MWYLNFMEADTYEQSNLMIDKVVKRVEKYEYSRPAQAPLKKVYGL